MKKLILLLACLITLPCFAFSLNFESLEICLKRHQEAYKKFEPEASQVKVTHEVIAYGARLVRTTTYSPETPHLREYLAAINALNNKLNTKAIAKGIVLGGLLGLVNATSLNIIMNQFKKINLEAAGLLGMIVINPLLLSIASIALENKLAKKAEPYFDEYRLHKSDNIFSMNLDSMERILFSSLAALFSQVIATPFFMGFMGKLKNS